VTITTVFGALLARARDAQPAQHIVVHSKKSDMRDMMLRGMKHPLHGTKILHQTVMDFVFYGCTMLGTVFAPRGLRPSTALPKKDGLRRAAVGTG
jgi:hypothetical protein